MSHSEAPSDGSSHRPSLLDDDQAPAVQTEHDFVANLRWKHWNHFVVVRDLNGFGFDNDPGRDSVLGTRGLDDYRSHTLVQVHNPPTIIDLGTLAERSSSGPAPS